MLEKKRKLIKSVCIFSSFVVLLFMVCILVYPQSINVDTIFKKEIQTKVNYCNLEVPEFWKQANSNFYLTYSFKLNERNEIDDLIKIRDDIVGETKVMQCVESWEISGLPKETSFILSFK